MGIATTNFNVTTAVTVIMSADTTWANSKGAGLYDPVQFKIRNSGVTPVRIGSVITTVAGSGFSLSSNTTFSLTLKSPGETLSVITSASTSNIDVMADRQ